MSTFRGCRFYHVKVLKWLLFKLLISFKFTPKQSRADDVGYITRPFEHSNLFLLQNTCKILIERGNSNHLADSRQLGINYWYSGFNPCCAWVSPSLSIRHHTTPRRAAPRAMHLVHCVDLVQGCTVQCTAAPPLPAHRCIHIHPPCSTPSVMSLPSTDISRPFAISKSIDSNYIIFISTVFIVRKSCQQRTETYLVVIFYFYYFFLFFSKTEFIL